MRVLRLGCTQQVLCIFVPWHAMRCVVTGEIVLALGGPAVVRLYFGAEFHRVDQPPGCCPGNRELQPFRRVPRYLVCLAALGCVGGAAPTTDGPPFDTTLDHLLEGQSAVVYF
jgi:hypothetical protein